MNEDAARRAPLAGQRPALKRAGEARCGRAAVFERCAASLDFRGRQAQRAGGGRSRPPGVAKGIGTRQGRDRRARGARSVTKSPVLAKPGCARLYIALCTMYIAHRPPPNHSSRSVMERDHRFTHSQALDRNAKVLNAVSHLNSCRSARSDRTASCCCASAIRERSAAAARCAGSEAMASAQTQ